MAKDRPARAGGTTYRILEGFSYPRPEGPLETVSPFGKKVTTKEIRMESGTTASDLPAPVAVAALAQGLIEPYQPPDSAANPSAGAAPLTDAKE